MLTISRRIIFLIFILAVSLPLSAQGALGPLPQSKAPASASSNASVDSLNRETPYGTVFGFLEAAQSGNYTIAAQYLQMSSARRQTDGEALAQKLQTVMNVAFAGSLNNVISM